MGIIKGRFNGLILLKRQINQCYCPKNVILKYSSDLGEICKRIIFLLSDVRNAIKGTEDAEN